MILMLGEEQKMRKILTKLGWLTKDVGDNEPYITTETWWKNKIYHPTLESSEKKFTVPR